MSAINNHPDLLLRRDYELARAKANPSCTTCDVADIQAKWERLARERDQAAKSPRIRP